ncbi:MAG TPA: biotin/lipoyl-containing protein [Pyrinomonadaceae bacterium]|nr:biotin/lipoyl-containing protein [Pyrinomonadaceae bacterium]
MKLHAAIAGIETDVEIRREADRLHARVGDVEYQLNARQTGPGSYLLISDGHVFDCRVEGSTESGAPLAVFVGTRSFEVTLADPKRLRGSQDPSAHDDGAARIVAPMPGKIVRVLAEVGAQIEAGAGVVVVEAMKMQNEMKSPKAGTVSAVNVEVGATVNGGDVLVVIE